MEYDADLLPQSVYIAHEKVKNLLWRAGVEKPFIIMDGMECCECLKSKFTEKYGIKYWENQYAWAKKFVAAKGTDISNLNKDHFMVRAALLEAFPDGGEKYSRKLKKLNDMYEADILRFVDEFNSSQFGK